MVTSVPLRGATHSKIDTAALIEITMAGQIPITGANGALFGLLPMVQMLSGKMRLNGQTTM